MVVKVIFKIVLVYEIASTELHSCSVRIGGGRVVAFVEFVDARARDDSRAGGPSLRGPRTHAQFPSSWRRSVLLRAICARNLPDTNCLRLHAHRDDAPPGRRRADDGRDPPAYIVVFIPRIPL